VPEAASPPAAPSPLPPFPGPLRGPRIVLRPFEPGDPRDLRDLREAVEETRPALLLFVPWGDQHRDDENTAAFIRRARADFDARTGFPWAIETADGAFLGGCGLHGKDLRARSFEIGYWIRASAEGRGYVQEAVRLATTAAFEHLEANRLELCLDTINDRSRRVAKRAGFVHEGTRRRSSLRCDGSLVDLEVHAMVREDYDAAKARWATEPVRVSAARP
jgi:ribosomal-protein-serine acetyltransferase